MYIAAVVHEFRSERIRETDDGVFRATISGLQGNRSICERRTNLYDDASVARLHALECRHGSVNVSEVGHFRCPPELFRGDFVKRRKNGGHGVVDPDVYRAEFVFYLLGRRLDLLSVRHIGNERQ